MQSSIVAAFGMLIVFEIAPVMKGCAAAIMRIWPSVEIERVPVRPHGLGAVEHRQCSGGGCGAPSSVIAPQTWMLAASISAREKPSAAKQVEAGIVELFRRHCRASGQEFFAERPFVERELDVEGRGEPAFERVECGRGRSPCAAQRLRG